MSVNARLAPLLTERNGNIVRYGNTGRLQETEDAVYPDAGTRRRRSWSIQGAGRTLPGGTLAWHSGNGPEEWRMPT
jgi:hypothetical protein